MLPIDYILLEINLKTRANLNIIEIHRIKNKFILL